MPRAAGAPPGERPYVKRNAFRDFRTGVIYRDFYREEIEHREHLRGAVGVPIALLTVLGGVLAYYSRTFQAVDGVVTWVFAVLFGSSCYFFIRAVYLLIRSYHGYTYERIPTPAQIRQYHQDLAIYLRSTKAPDGQLASEFDDFLDGAYCRAAERNTYNNLAKSEYLFRATGAIIFCLALTAIAVVPVLLSIR